MSKEIYYGWHQLCQWDIKPSDAYVKYKNVDTGLSKGICCFMLVKITDMGNGHTKYKKVIKDEATPEILKKAGDV